jgi:copper transport protein
MFATTVAVLVGGVGIALVVASAAPAAAHASLQSSSPPANQVLTRPPAEVTLTFDEPVEPGPGGVRVLRSDGTNAASGPVEQRSGGTVLAVPVGGDGTGTYTVTWRVVSKDGHTILGSYVFHVGEATGTTGSAPETSAANAAVGALSRWLAFAGGIIAFGVAMFVLLVERASRIVAGRARRLMAACGVAVVVGTAGAALARVADASGTSIVGAFDHLDLLTSTRYGRLDLVWLIAAVALLICAGVPPLCRYAITTVYAGIVFLGVPAFSGHAWTTSPAAVGVAADVIHILAVAVWVGGFAALLVAVKDESDPSFFVARYSEVALPAAGLTVATGATSSVLEVGSVSALLETPYGRLLIAKLALVTIILIIGYVNRSRLVGVVDRTAEALRNVRVELALGMVVLAVTSILVTQAPARNSANKPFAGVVTAALPGGRVELEVSRTPGPAKELHLTFTGDDGRPLDMDAVEVQVASSEVAPRKVPLTTITASHYIAPNVAMTPPGTWQVRITAVRGGEPSITTVEVPIT